MRAWDISTVQLLGRQLRQQRMRLESLESGAARIGNPPEELPGIIEQQRRVVEAIERELKAVTEWELSYYAQPKSEDGA